MTVRVAINGFGRIGRNVVRALYESGRRAEITVVAINELADAAGMAHLLKYDTSHGRFAWDVRQEREQLFVGDDAIRVLHENSIEGLPWRELGVDVVLDCTGVYGNREHGEAHLNAGAKKVLFSHPGSNDLDATVVFGVNQHELQAEHRIVSNASCTTNCIIPVIKLLDDAYGIESGTVTTIHSAMHDQQVIDAYHPDLRRTRAASQSIIPVDTKLAAGITRIFPQFNDRSTDIHGVLYYSKNANELRDIFIDELLGCTAPLSAGGQRDSFNALVEDTLGDDCRYDTVLSIHEKLNDLIESQKDEPEPVVLTKSEVKRLFEECGVEDEKLQSFDEQYEITAGEKSSLVASNITNTKKFEIKTPDVVVHVDPERADLVETRVIDGRKCLVIPMEGEVELNGIRVHTGNENPSDDEFYDNTDTETEETSDGE